VILAAGLTPAWQQILVFDRFTRGEVNRASETCACASGKVINVGLALTTLGARSKTLSVLGGPAGTLIEEELLTHGVAARWIHDPANTRTCTTIIEQPTGEITELVENAATIKAQSCDAFIAALQEEAKAADWIVLSGSLPPIEGRPSNRTLYREMLNAIGHGTTETNRPASQVILDARGPEMVECLSCRPFLVKPNREELAATVGRKLSTEAELFEAMREINSRGAQWVLVTHGAKEVWLSSSSELWQFTPPRVEVVNAIGCGDCLTAGLVASLDAGHSLPDAVRYGIASAGDNATQLLPSRLSPKRVLALADRVGVSRVQ
jgi:tagatose 6-phosphate kinase